MRKRLIFLSFILTWFHTSRAQSYSQGDISFNFITQMNHDSASCETIGHLYYEFTIQNSFIGDSLKIWEMGTLNPVFEEVNTTGQNPWIFVSPVSIYSGIVPDSYLSPGNIAEFIGPSVMVICESDTVFDVNNYFSTHVDNICAYGTVTGRIYIDNNGDCIYNLGDSALSGLYINSYIGLSNLGNTQTSAITDTVGNYELIIQESWMTNYTVFPSSQYQFIFPDNLCTPSGYSFSILSQSGIDFALQCPSPIDVQCYIGTNDKIKPLTPFYLWPRVNNLGCNPTSGDLKLILDPNVIYLPSPFFSPPDSISGDTLIWHYFNITNLTSGAYFSSFLSSIELIPKSFISSGDSLCFHIITDVPLGDIDITNNEYFICIPVSNSFASINKVVFPEGVGAEGNIPENTEELYYTIHFQNTSNSIAYNIEIIDTLDSSLDPNSLTILSASDYLSPIRLSSNVVKFGFYGIELPDSSIDELNSHGYVHFKIKLKSGLANGTKIRNTAYLYYNFMLFDSTNTTLNTVNTSTGIKSIDDSKFQVYPNPANEKINICNLNSNNDENFKFSIYNYLGQEVYKSSILNKVENISTNSFGAKGVYLLVVCNKNNLIIYRNLFVVE